MRYLVYFEHSKPEVIEIMADDEESAETIALEKLDAEYEGVFITEIKAI